MCVFRLPWEPKAPEMQGVSLSGSSDHSLVPMASGMQVLRSPADHRGLCCLPRKCLGPLRFWHLLFPSRKTPPYVEEAGSPRKPKGRKKAGQVGDQGETRVRLYPILSCWRFITTNKHQTRCLFLGVLIWRFNSCHLGWRKNPFHHLTIRQITGKSNKLLKMRGPGQIVIWVKSDCCQWWTDLRATPSFPGCTPLCSHFPLSWGEIWACS